MQHHKKQRTLGRTRRARTALMRGLAVSLIENGQITTSLAKAKELRPYVERLITTAKGAGVSERRRIATVLGEPNNRVVQTLCDEIAPRYVDRPGGYTRIVKMGRTAGRDEAVIEFV